MVLTIDCLLRIYAHDEYLKSGWIRMLIFVLSVDYVRLVLVAVALPGMSSVILMLQCLRPYYIIFSASSLRLFLKTVTRTLPKIFDFVWIIACVVLVFGLIGYELFKDVDPLYFGSKQTALFSMLVTLTTANFPDVMMEAFNHSPYAVI